MQWHEASCSLSATATAEFLVTKLGEMTEADKEMNPLHFGSDPEEIRIRIIPEIQIQIPDYFWLRYRRIRAKWLALRAVSTRVCLLKNSSFSFLAQLL